MTRQDLVTVTGASGFIALHTTRQLLAAGYAVRGTLRSMDKADGIARALAARGDDVSHLSFARADLTADDGWDAALEGADYLIHMASPVPAEAPKDENDLITPARDGALRALRAACDAGVKRIVMTSSIAAISGGHDKSQQLDEGCWSDVTKDIGAYQKSKTLAEKAAWDYIAALPVESRPEFAVINPGFVLGPVIGGQASASLEIVRRLMAREVPGVPNIGFSLVDVRDVAAAHVTALIHTDAPGNRFICVAESMTFREIARHLADYLAPQGYKIPTRPVPDWLVHFLALFSPTFKLVATRLGPATAFDTRAARTRLDWQPRSMVQSLFDTADSLGAQNITRPGRTPS